MAMDRSCSRAPARCSSLAAAFALGLVAASVGCGTPAAHSTATPSTGTALAARSLPPGFTEAFADVNGVRLHYMIGGSGSPVVLLHGYAETSHMWLPLMPLLAPHHRVIVPDLRGAGD